MMTDEELARAVDRVFLNAGWAPHFGLHGYWRRTAGGWLVGGAPDPAKPLETHMKITDKDPDTVDTPDDPVLAAQWLVARFAAAPEAEPDALVLHVGEEEADMAQPININVSPVFNVGGSSANADAQGKGGDSEADSQNHPQVDLGEGGGPPVGIEAVVSHTDAGATDAVEAAPTHEALTDVQEPVCEEGQPAPEAGADHVDLGADLAAEGDDGSVAVGGDNRGRELLPAHGPDGEGGGDEDEEDEVWDAEFNEPEDDEALDAAIERALLEDDGHDLGEELARDYQPQQPYNGPTYVGLDDLDRLQRIKIGDVAAHAAALTLLIESEVNEQPGEYAAVQGYVTSHLHPHTGAFWGEDRAKWDRFLVLEAAQTHIASIERVRKEKTADLLSFTTREQVAAFDVMAGWP